LFVGPASLFIEFMLFLWFHHIKTKEDIMNFKLSVYFFQGILGMTLGFSMLGFLMYFVIHFDGSVIMSYGKVIGLLSSILTLVQWLPQIYTTWKLRHPGSLSLPMLFIQTPGSVIVIFFQITVGSDVTTWFPYVVTFISQASLIVMCFIFICQEQVTYLPDESDKLILGD